MIIPPKTVVNAKMGSKKRKTRKRKSTKWTDAMVKARDEMGFTEFVPLHKGSPLYTRTKDIYEKMKSSDEKHEWTE